jgi:gamma-glutamyl:cysteine ligase YbdK (ATP-grasp superfamily)
MGLSIDRSEFADEEYATAAARLRENLHALELLLQRPGFGEGPSSLVAELEMSIIDANAAGLPVNREVLADCNDPNLQLELDRFNLEYNLSPVAAAGRPFTSIEQELTESIARIDRAAAGHCGSTIAIGILPTLTLAQLQENAMTEMPRYQALSKGVKRIRGEHFRIRIDGKDPLDQRCEHLTTEGANTSFQLHLRVDPREFAATFNAAQLVTPLALAVSCNSPFFLGHRLWAETRIALFKQSVDTRGATSPEWRRAARVPFGHGWVRNGAHELFAESCFLYPILVPVCSDEDPLAVVKDGGVPELAELRLQQGTIWNWNRAVYDSAGGGHVRIEFRALPSGPTSLDMMASAAFLTGLTIGLRHSIDALLPALPFRYAEYNFYRAAQHGLDAELLWPDFEEASPKQVPVLELCRELLPVAEQGLQLLQVDDAEQRRLLDIIRDRLDARLTPADWQRRTLEKYTHRDRWEGLAAMVHDYQRFSKSGRPVTEWP